MREKCDKKPCEYWLEEGNKVPQVLERAPLQPLESTTVKQVFPYSPWRESAVYSEPSVGQARWQEL